MEKCGECNKNEEKHNNVPYIVLESSLFAMERIFKRLWIVIILLILLLVGSNALWIVYENSFEDSETTITQENADGYNNYIGNDGNIMNGETDG